jgi:hypothetical protein
MRQLQLILNQLKLYYEHIDDLLILINILAGTKIIKIQNLKGFQKMFLSQPNITYPT